ncbi:MAG: ATP-binding cassette domain-containing protein, partial [Gemmataceae bacterium]
MPARFQMRGIRKRYGSTVALDGVDLELQPGEVHAVIGENGAGKSTLMKILAGAEIQDSGEMFCDGAPYSPGDPQHARRRGVAMVYQELTLAPHLSVEANLLLGAEPHRFGFLRGSVIREKARQVLDLIAHPDIQPGASIASLNPASRQLVEIARALLLDLRILILDEPTSSLGRADVVRLFQLIRQMQTRGVTVVYISHFLEEVREIADRFTVLRDGKSVSTGAIQDVTLQHIIEKMVGRNVEEQYPRVPHHPGEPILSLKDLEGEKNPRGVSLELRKGEILGIAGVIGAGRTELLRAIAGLDPIRRGNLRLVRIPSTDLRHLSVRQRIDRGIG